MKEEIEDFYRCLQRLIHSKQLSIPSMNYDLVMDIMVADDGRILWSYYYACHESRCLFWLETYDASFMKSRLFGVKSPAHISELYMLRSEFLTVYTAVVRRASFGGALLVGLSSPTGLVSSALIFLR